MVADSKRLGFPFLAGSSLPVTPVSGSGCPVGNAAHRKRLRGLWRSRFVRFSRTGDGTMHVRAPQRRRGRDCACPRRAWRKDLENARGTRDDSAAAASGVVAKRHTSRREGVRQRSCLDRMGAQISGNLAGVFHRPPGRVRTTLFLVPIRDFNYAGLNGETGEIISCQMNLPMPTQSATTANFFNPLIRHIERMIVENRAPYPVERTLLTSGMTLAAVESLFRGEIPVQTPEMEVRYSAPKESQFWRA